MSARVQALFPGSHDWQLRSRIMRPFWPIRGRQPGNLRCCEMVGGSLRWRAEDFPVAFASGAVAPEPTSLGLGAVGSAGLLGISLWSFFANSAKGRRPRQYG